MPMEAWKFAGKRVWRRVVELMRRIWREGTIPQDWRNGIIIPLQREDKEKVENYREIMIFDIYLRSQFNFIIWISQSNIQYKIYTILCLYFTIFCNRKMPPKVDVV